MTNKVPVFWAQEAQLNLQSIRQYIAKDNPEAATAFIRRIRARARKIGVMPTAGVPVAESSDSNVRETYVGSYRIIYRLAEDRVRILMVIHGARLLSDDRLKEIR